MAEVVSVAYVVDASLALASEWNQILTEYLLPLLQRLAEAHTNTQVSILLLKNIFVTWNECIEKFYLPSG